MPEALHDAAVDLALHQHRVDHLAHVIDDRVTNDSHSAGRGIDFDLADVGAVRERDRRRRERRALGEAGLHAGRQLTRLIRRARDLRPRDAAIGARDRELSVAERDVLMRGLHHPCRDPTSPFDDLLRRTGDGRPADGERARAAVAAAGAEQIAVAPEHLDPLRGHAQAIRHDLCERGLVTLSHRRRAREDRHRAVGVDADLRGVGIDRRVGTAGDLDRVRDPEAAQHAARSRFGAALVEPGVVRERERHVHPARELTAVVREDEPRLEWHRRRRDQVAAPQLQRVDPELARGDVDDAFDRVRGLGPPGAAIRTGRRGVGVHARGLHVNRGRRVHARDAADVVRPRARAARCEIRADVERDGDAKPEELAVRVERQLRRRDVVAAVLVGDEPLAAIRRPLHRTAEPLRGPEHQHVLGIRAALHPEASADLRGHHAQVALRDAEDLLGQERAQSVRMLDASMKRVAPGPTVVLANGAARLDRRGSDAADDVVELHHVRGALESARDFVFLARLPHERDVVRYFVPHRRGAGASRVYRSRHGRKRLVIDADQVQSVGRLLRRFGDNERHGIADVAHAAAGQRGTRGRERRRAIGLFPGTIGRQVTDLARRQIRGGEDRQHAGGA